MKIFARLSHKKRASLIIEILSQSTKNMVEPATKQIINHFGRNPYLILISCILSLRTKDTVSLPASLRLFERAQTPQAMLALQPNDITHLIYPCGFYNTKTITIMRISEHLIQNFAGKVPSTRKELLTLPGVGIKTAALVLSQAFEIPALCVDTHVHRISNRLGLVDTKNAAETECELEKVVPKEHWGDWNQLLVMWGQNVCVPVSPFCSRCPLITLCPQKNVIRHR